MKSKIHPLDAELFELIEEHEAQQALAHRYPVASAVHNADATADLTPEEEALYRAAFPDEVEA